MIILTQERRPGRLALVDTILSDAQTEELADWIIATSKLWVF
jgi:hypothetical protein